jgi:hypothetical protein
MYEASFGACLSYASPGWEKVLRCSFWIERIEELKLYKLGKLFSPLSPAVLWLVDIVEENK